MITTNATQSLILASKSPRRAKLLQQIKVPFEVVSVDTDELVDHALSPEQNITKIATEKAQAVQAIHPNRRILAADTMVVIDNHILGKPKDQEDALGMLKLLSGSTHRVITAVVVIDERGEQHSALNISKVRFKTLSQQEMLDYWLSGEPQDKAGAYGIQGLAATFVEHIEGSYSSIMGLPLFETAQLLNAGASPN